MSANRAEIYTGALFNIGHAKGVDNPSENTNEAKNCNKIYDKHRKSILSMANWGFAKVFRTLAQTANTPPTGWEYEYAYPSDCLRVIEIAKTAPTDPKIPFTSGHTYDSTTGQQKRVIWTNHPNAVLVFVRDVTNEGLFSPMFTQTLQHRMSVDLAKVMAKKTDVAKEQMNWFQWSMNEAVRLNEIESEDQPQPDADWIRDR